MNERSATRVTGFSFITGFFGQNVTMLTGDQNGYRVCAIIAHLHAAITAFEENRNVSYMILSIVSAILGELLASQLDLFSTNYSQEQRLRA